MEADSMKRQQARNDERDNKRAFRIAAITVIVLLLGVLAYNFLISAREDEPVKQGAVPEMWQRFG